MYNFMKVDLQKKKNKPFSSKVAGQCFCCTLYCMDERNNFCKTFSRLFSLAGSGAAGFPNIVEYNFGSNLWEEHSVQFYNPFTVQFMPVPYKVLAFN